MLAGDSEEASEGVLDPVQVAEATGKVLETPVETEDQIVVDIVTTGNAMLADGQEDQESAETDLETFEKNDEILVHDEASEDAEESQQEGDEISEAEERSESESDDGTVLASSRDESVDSEGVQESVK